MQDIIQNSSTSVHDDPTSIIAHFELLLDEEIDGDFLRDAIESIAQYYHSQYPQYYNSQYPGDVSMPYQNEYTVV